MPSGRAENFVELVLEESPHEVADHVVVVADVEDGRNVQIESGIACHWRGDTNNSSPLNSLIVNQILKN